MLHQQSLSAQRGPAGLWMETWSNITVNDGSLAAFGSTSRYPLHPDTGKVSTQGGVSSNGGVWLEAVTRSSGFMEQSSGWFVAPLSANYTFYILSNFQSDLWLSTTANASDLVRRCALQYYSARFVFLYFFLISTLRVPPPTLKLLHCAVVLL